LSGRWPAGVARLAPPTDRYALKHRTSGRRFGRFRSDRNPRRLGGRARGTLAPVTAIATVASATVTATATIAVTRGPCLLLAHHRRRREDRFLFRDVQVAQHRIVELERVLELGQRFAVDTDVHQHVMGLVDLGDRVSELAPTPVLETVDPAILAGDGRAIPLDHRGHLLALVRMHDENDFVVTHAEHSLWTVGRRLSRVLS